MKVLHVSAECYPAAKSGGLGDVVGALPKYLNQRGIETGVIIPKYRTKWLQSQEFEHEMSGTIRMDNGYIPYSIEYVKNKTLGFPLFVVNCPTFFDREGIYNPPSGGGFHDEVERWLGFQQAVIHWCMSLKPDVLHCHDHHTGLIPFMINHCPEYQSLRNTATIFTIHNGQYHGMFSWKKLNVMPFFNSGAAGILDWKDTINPLATGIKCAWRVTTVSPGYLFELKGGSSGGLEALIASEWSKSYGILNGIDTEVWNPANDPLIAHHLEGTTVKDVNVYKAKNKELLSKRFRIDPFLPLITFIGRIVGEKGADLLPDAISQFLQRGGKACFVVLGTGEKWVADKFSQMKYQYVNYFDTSLEYNETLAHQLYAGSDFLIMPSRVEPCGLNQMYSLRYGTVPIVRSIGGLKDTVKDVGEGEQGCGIRFDRFAVDDTMLAMYRATKVYENWDYFTKLRHKIMQINHSWDKSAADYEALYHQVV